MFPNIYSVDKRMRNHIGIIVFLVLPLVVLGQNKYDAVSIVTTKSGMRYLGTVTEGKEKLTIKLLDGNLVIVPQSDIKRYLPHEDITVYSGGKYHMNRGWFSMLAQGVAFGGGPNGESNSSQFNIILGKYLKPRASLGLGVGSEVNDKDLGDFTINTQVLSLFGYGRYDVTNTSRKLFIYGRLGYGLANVDPELETTEKGGLNAGFGIGILFANSKKAKVSIMLGYHHQSASGVQNFIDEFGNEVVADYDLDFHRIGLTFAFEVNRKARRK